MANSNEPKITPNLAMALSHKVTFIALYHSLFRLTSSPVHFECLCESFKDVEAGNQGSGLMDTQNEGWMKDKGLHD